MIHLLTTFFFLSLSCGAQSLTNLNKSIKFGGKNKSNFQIKSLNKSGDILGSYPSEQKTNNEIIFIAYPNKAGSYLVEIVGEYFLPKIYQITDEGTLLVSLPLNSIDKYEPAILQEDSLSGWKIKTLFSSYHAVEFMQSNGSYLIINNKKKEITESDILNLEAPQKKIMSKKNQLVTLVSVNASGWACGSKPNGEKNIPILYYAERDTLINFLSTINGFASSVNDSGQVCGTYYTDEMEERAFLFDIKSMSTFNGDNLSFRDLNPDVQTVPMYMNNKGTIVARSKGSFIYFSHGNKYLFDDLINNSSSNENIKKICSNIVSLNDKNQCIIKCKGDGAYYLVHIP